MKQSTQHPGGTTPRVPVQRRPPVTRRRLAVQLDRAATRPLTLVVAPAGYGKTLLLTSWAVDCDPPAAWVTLGPEDRQPSRFWTHVLEALHNAGVPAPRGLTVEDDAWTHAGHPFVRSFAGWLDTLPDPVVLVVDDLHEVSGTAVPAGLRHLLRHAAARLRLIVASRTDPQLSLQWLRMAGQVTEIRRGALAFTLPETRELLADEGITLPDSVLEALWRRTEGWAAGLRLATLTLREHPDPGRYVDELTGDDEAIAGYFAEEVLASQSPELRAFLLRTSVVDRLCGELAEALTGRSDGAQILARLEREQVFTFRIGRAGSWHRYHRLFAELLRSELGERPRELAALHRRAAAWHAANARPVDAIHHALSGDDVDHAARLVTSTWFSQLMDGRADQLRTLLTRLPAERVRRTPHLAAVTALSRLALGELHEADAWLSVAAAAEPRLSSSTAPRADTLGVSMPRARETSAALTLARLFRARLVGDAAAASAAAQLLLAGGPDVAPEKLGVADDRHALVFALLGAAQMWSGQLGDAATHLERARADAARTGREYVELDATAHLALLESLRGSLTLVDGLVRSARAQADRNGWSTGAGVACAELAAAVTAYHTDELAVAAQALEHATEAARDDAMLQLTSAVAEALLAAGQGPTPRRRAVEHLDAALRATGGRPPALLAPAARAVRARLLAATGDYTAAVATVLAGHREPLAAIEVATLGRLQLAGGDPVAAVATVAPLLAGEHGDPASFRLPWVIEASLVDAVAHDALTDHAAASRSLRRALELGAAEGYRRAFVEGGTPVQVLLVEHLKRDTANRAMATVLLERLRAAAAPVTRTGTVSTAGELAAPLSNRELVVLQYLPTTLSAREISDEMYVSLNTVKTHIKNIYRKLDCNRRWEAVRRARQLRLL